MCLFYVHIEETQVSLLCSQVVSSIFTCCVSSMFTCSLFYKNVVSLLCSHVNIEETRVGKHVCTCEYRRGTKIDADRHIERGLHLSLCPFDVYMPTRVYLSLCVYLRLSFCLFYVHMCTSIDLSICLSTAIAHVRHNGTH